ncbi:unnamed protein product, partial [Phaeothamnion confervicola]
MRQKRVPNFIGGTFMESETDQWLEVRNPATQELVCETPQSTHAEMEAAVASASEAFQKWRLMPVQQRQRVFFNLQQLIRDNTEQLAHSITTEQGKTLAADSRGDVFRGLEVVEAACGASTHMMGQTLMTVARGVDTHSYLQPLGVTAGICPFNFPAMIPLWMFPMALVAGNTMVLKPSERDPGAAVLLASLAQRAGLPDGCLNLIHGGKQSVDFICDAPAVRAISFVGSNAAGEYIFARGTANGKRVQANLGAKNHGVVLPDADKAATINAIVGAAFGAAGQRCMALSVAVLVGAAREWVPEIAAAAQLLRLGAGDQEGTDIGPMISPAALKRAESIVTDA